MWELLPLRGSAKRGQLLIMDSYRVKNNAIIVWFVFSEARSKDMTSTPEKFGAPGAYPGQKITTNINYRNVCDSDKTRDILQR